MSTTTHAPPVPIRAALRRYALLVVLLLAIVAGASIAFLATRADPVPGDVPGVFVPATGGDGCASSLAVSGGLIEGHQANDRCGTAAGDRQLGGIQR